jgi:hypothetical protein
MLQQVQAVALAEPNFVSRRPLHERLTIPGL